MKVKHLGRGRNGGRMKEHLKNLLVGMLIAAVAYSVCFLVMSVILSLYHYPIVTGIGLFLILSYGFGKLWREFRG